MCRFAAYLGPPRALSTLLYDAPHCLERQSYLPQEMVSGNVNVDGTGIAWWSDDEAPLRYVSDRPPWSDPNLPELSRRLVGAPQLAVVRSQTPGMPAGVGAAHPFTFKNRAGTLNGYLERFEEVRWRLLDELGAEARGAVSTLSDAEVVFLLAVSLLDRWGNDLLAAVTAAVHTAAVACREAGGAASLNVTVAERTQVVAVRTAADVEANSLYWLEGGRSWPDAIVLASEPLDDDDGWRAVPPDHTVTLSANGARCAPLASGDTV